jgi:hypothetical protein
MRLFMVMGAYCAMEFDLGRGKGYRVLRTDLTLENIRLGSTGVIGI